jgi:release factor glutamine methyltransferase
MLTVKAALEEATHAIGRVDAQVLMAHLLGVNRAYLAANPMRVLTESEDARVDLMVAQRAMGQPVAYLVGKREFYSREFEVGPEVLIPRPETETLVEAVLRHSREDGNPASALDLGTGSGILAITLACELPGITVTATDTSPAALATAARNAKALGVVIELLEGAWYAPVPGRRFDVILSNPPYIAAGDPHLAEGDLRFEPPGALTDGSPDGLASIRAIVEGARAHLNPGGRLLLEHGYDQQAAVSKIMAGAGFTGIVSIPDLAGIPRVAGGKIER